MPNDRIGVRSELNVKPMMGSDVANIMDIKTQDVARSNISGCDLSSSQAFLYHVNAAVMGMRAIVICMVIVFSLKLSAAAFEHAFKMDWVFWYEHRRFAWDIKVI